MAARTGFPLATSANMVGMMNLAYIAVAVLVVGGAAFKFATRPAAVAPAEKPALTAEATAAATAVDVRVEPVAVGALDQPVRVTGTLVCDESEPK